MRSESRYPVDTLGDSSQPSHGQRNRASVIYYFSTGERVPSGIYCCTFCGGEISCRADSVLPLCPMCDSAEFTLVEREEAA